MQKVYDKISEISSSTFVVEADDVGLGEIARVEKQNGTTMLAMSIRVEGKKVVMQALESTSGLATTDRVVFLKHRMRTHVGKELLGRRFDGQGRPIDGGPMIEGAEVDLSHQSVNPVQRTIPSEMVRTNIPMIDVYNTLVRSQKLPIFSVTGERYNELLMRIANQTDADLVIIGGMGLRYNDYLKFIENAETHGSMQKTIMYINLATQNAIECLLVPDMALTVAEQYAMKGANVLVLLTDMTSYAEAHREISISLDILPAARAFPGDLYSLLAFRYEKAVEFVDKGSITILTVTTMPAGDVTHPVPDNTGYITEGQFYMINGSINPFGSLSRLKQLVQGKKTREDHSTVANTTIGFYAEALKARERQSMGFKLSKWDEKLIKFASLFEEHMMDLNKNIPLEEALDRGWMIMAECFQEKEVSIKKELMDKYWPR